MRWDLFVMIFLIKYFNEKYFSSAFDIQIKNYVMRNNVNEDK